MFLKKLFNFNKDCNYYLEKGDKYLAEERFSDARNAYCRAVEKMEASGETEASGIEAVRRKIALTGDMLGRLNLMEAEGALCAGNREKAEEHLHLVLDLAEDATIREQSERLLAELQSGVALDEDEGTAPESVSDETRATEPVAAEDVSWNGDEHISGEERLSLFFHTLPGDLPERYAEMGEEFARGCLLNLEGDREGALRVFEALSPAENDILDYEKAIIFYHGGDAGKCEELLNRAISMNPANPLCNIGLVQLYAETGRTPEALQLLERMILGNVIPEQARLMQGDLFTSIRDVEKAVESYSTLLSSPKYARDAAERLVPLLKKQGRSEEAKFLAKKYGTGCC